MDEHLRYNMIAKQPNETQSWIWITYGTSLLENCNRNQKYEQHCFDEGGGIHF